MDQTWEAFQEKIEKAYDHMGLEDGPPKEIGSLAVPEQKKTLHEIEDNLVRFLRKEKLIGNWDGDMAGYAWEGRNLLAVIEGSLFSPKQRQCLEHLPTSLSDALTALGDMRSNIREISGEEQPTLFQAAVENLNRTLQYERDGGPYLAESWGYVRDVLDQGPLSEQRKVLDQLSYALEHHFYGPEDLQREVEQCQQRVEEQEKQALSSPTPIPPKPEAKPEAKPETVKKGEEPTPEIAPIPGPPTPWWKRAAILVTLGVARLVVAGVSRLFGGGGDGGTAPALGLGAALANGGDASRQAPPEAATPPVDLDQRINALETELSALKALRQAPTPEAPDLPEPVLAKTSPPLLSEAAFREVLLTVEQWSQDYTGEEMESVDKNLAFQQAHLAKAEQLNALYQQTPGLLWNEKQQQALLGVKADLAEQIAVTQAHLASLPPISEAAQTAWQTLTATAQEVGLTAALHRQDADRYSVSYARAGKDIPVRSAITGDQALSQFTREDDHGPKATNTPAAQASHLKRAVALELSEAAMFVHAPQGATLANAPAVVLSNDYASAQCLAEALGHATVETLPGAKALHAAAQTLRADFPDKPLVMAGEVHRRDVCEAFAKELGATALIPTFAPGESGNTFADLAKSSLGLEGVERQARATVTQALNHPTPERSLAPKHVRATQR